LQGGNISISSDSEKPSNSEGNNSLSFGSDTDYLSDTYVILDAEVKRNGSIALGSLLRPGVIQETTLILEEDPIERTGFFPVFSRYFVWKGRSFKNMVADLIHHREANQNEGAPLIVRADVPKLRQIAHKRMGFLKATYRIFKDFISPDEKQNIELIKTYMKVCVRHYHSLLPQLDLIACPSSLFFL
jgi:hypothetical protein